MMCVAATASEVDAIVVWPARADMIAGGLLLCGASTRSSPLARRNSSPARSPDDATPGDALLNLPGLARTNAINSFRVLAGTEGLIVSTCGESASKLIGEKSLTASYGRS